MAELKKKSEGLLESLQERAKELNCLYHVEEALKDIDQPLPAAFERVLSAIPAGWQFPAHCQARIAYRDVISQTTSSHKAGHILKAEALAKDGSPVSVEIGYTDLPLADDADPFLEEEVKLINTIAGRLAEFIRHQGLRDEMEEIARETARVRRAEWRVLTRLLRRVNKDLYQRIARKMLNHLFRAGIPEVNSILQRFSPETEDDVEALEDGSNRPTQRRELNDTLAICSEIFDVAERRLTERELLSCVRRWMKQDQISFLNKTLEDPDSSLEQITDALRRYVNLASEGAELSDSSEKGARVALLRRIVSDQLNYLKIAKNFVEVKDFHELLKHSIFPKGSHGQLGGKSAGLFLAHQIIKKKAVVREELRGIKVPKTWYLTSDGLYHFVQHNNLEEVIEQKYKEIEQVRRDYPYLIQLFKVSYFPADLVHGLSVALDDFGDRPIIVRSSSLLEDRFGSTFSGKYKSLFLANQGSKEKKLAALIDAIAEVYSSTFGPDPIEYRAERDLLDFSEEMGIIIQEVVGRRIGKYFLPAFAGVAFSSNEFRWSPRIRREDGLIRMVPGLGTRAVDRLSDDYPILLAPGQPGLRVNISKDEIVRYSPSHMDVINLEVNTFETIDVRQFIREYGDQIPWVGEMASVVYEDHIGILSSLNFDFDRDDLVVNFEGLIRNTPFVQQIMTMLQVLQETLGLPVDTEFAHDGTDLYLLQCRPQGFSGDASPAVIPKDIPKSCVLFTAERFVSNGSVPDISHIIYVDPQAYAEIEDPQTLADVGAAVGKLNKLLPKRKFLMMGPGRWGSRGDIKLGVKVTYSEINNAAMLIEIARKQGNYVPDLSFGTHFFQDLVESAIRYLPLYPDDPDIIFKEKFFTESPNILDQLLPQAGHLAGVLKVIDVRNVSDGRVVKVFMNADREFAMGALCPCPTPQA